MPLYNIAPHLHECPNFFRTQTFANRKGVCVHDVVSDESAAILAEYAVNNICFRAAPQEQNGTDDDAIRRTVA